jgi:hypothetical protein
MGSKGKEVFPGFQEYPPVISTPEQSAMKLNQEGLGRAAYVDPAELYPHLHVLLRHRGFNFQEAYSRKETIQILGISDKTLGRWSDQGLITLYGLPDVCTSAKDLEDCIAATRTQSKQTLPEEGKYVS